MWGIRFSCDGDVGGYAFLWIEESCYRDSISNVSVGVMSWYIIVGFGILTGVGDMELGLGCLYYLFTYLYGIQVDEYVTRLSNVSSMMIKRRRTECFCQYCIQCSHSIVVYGDSTEIIGGPLSLRCGICSAYI